MSVFGCIADDLHLKHDPITNASILQATRALDYNNSPTLGTQKAQLQHPDFVPHKAGSATRLSCRALEEADKGGGQEGGQECTVGGAAAGRWPCKGTGARTCSIWAVGLPAWPEWRRRAEPAPSKPEPCNQGAAAASTGTCGSGNHISQLQPGPGHAEAEASGPLH